MAKTRVVKNSINAKDKIRSVQLGERKSFVEDHNANKTNDVIKRKINIDTSEIKTMYSTKVTAKLDALKRGENK